MFTNASYRCTIEIACLSILLTHGGITRENYHVIYIAKKTEIKDSVLKFNFFLLD